MWVGAGVVGVALLGGLALIRYWQRRSGRVRPRLLGSYSPIPGAIVMFLLAAFIVYAWKRSQRARLRPAGRGRRPDRRRVLGRLLPRRVGACTASQAAPSGGVRMNRERLKGHLDLLAHVGSRRRASAHGYAILASLRERSEGEFDLPEGTIYPALHRLEEAGLLGSTWADSTGRKRRVYALTDKGVAALAAERSEWRRFAGRRPGSAAAGPSDRSA